MVKSCSTLPIENMSEPVPCRALFRPLCDWIDDSFGDTGDYDLKVDLIVLIFASVVGGAGLLYAFCFLDSQLRPRGQRMKVE